MWWCSLLNVHNMKDKTEGCDVLRATTLTCACPTPCVDWVVEHVNWNCIQSWWFSPLARHNSQTEVGLPTLCGLHKRWSHTPCSSCLLFVPVDKTLSTAPSWQQPQVVAHVWSVPPSNTCVRLCRAKPILQTYETVTRQIISPYFGIVF